MFSQAIRRQTLYGLRWSLKPAITQRTGEWKPSRLNTYFSKFVPVFSSRSNHTSSRVPNDIAFCSDKYQPTTSDSDIDNRHSHEKSLLIGFTCNVCSTRSHKFMSKQAYYHGVVLIKCEGCKNLHLIADRIGWFSEHHENHQQSNTVNEENVARTVSKKGVDIEDLMERKGMNVKRASVGMEWSGERSGGSVSAQDKENTNSKSRTEFRLRFLERLKNASKDSTSSQGGDEGCMEFLQEDLLRWEATVQSQLASNNSENNS